MELGSIKPLDFQQPLQGEADPQEGIGLPLEVLEHIGRMCPDVVTATRWTRTCRLLYLSRPKILTGQQSMLQWTLQKLISHQSYLASFLDHCTTSPFRFAEFEITGSQVSDRDRIIAVMPNVKVILPVNILAGNIDLGRIARIFQQVAHIQIPRLHELWRPRNLQPQREEPLPAMFEPAPQYDMAEDLYQDEQRLEDVQIDIHNMINNLRV